MIEKAVKNGWYDESKKMFFKYYPRFNENEKRLFINNIYRHLKWVAIVFSKDFCKAYFGDEEVCGVDGEKSPFCKIHSGRWGVVWKPAWNYHRHQMLDADDPIEYMWRFY